MRKVTLFLLLVLLFSSHSLSGQELIFISAEDNIKAGEIFHVKAHFEFPANHYQAKNPDFFYIKVYSDSPYFSDQRTVYPPAVQGTYSENFHGSTELLLVIKIPAAAVPAVYNLTAEAAYQLCEEDGTCLFPVKYEKTFTVEIKPPEKYGLFFYLKILVFALLGGLLLNIMPCVLPVLSIKALHLVKLGNGSSKSIRINGLAYTAGIIFSMLLLGASTAALKALGSAAGWGFQFQNPVFTAAVISAVFVFALSMFGVFTISISISGKKLTSASGNAYGASFISGIFAVVLATPCSAPFLGTAAGFALAADTAMIILVFVFIGLGLSLPFLLFAFFPGLTAFLPKPGNWMETLKKAMGFILIGTALWLMNIYLHQTGGTGLFRLTVFLGLLSFLFWLYAEIHKKLESAKTSLLLFFMLIISVLVLWLTVPGLNRKAESSFYTDRLRDKQEILFMETEPFSLKKALEYQNSGRTVFIDLYARWCLTCAFNEKTVIFTEQTKKLFEKNSIIFMRGDYTLQDPEIESWIKSMGRAGVPVYAFYFPGRDRALLLPELITYAMLEKALDN
jgi:thiol:disulfide interchange protein DsbD